MTEENHSLGGQYLTLSLGKEEFGVHIRHVHEIICITPITQVPLCPHYVKGVINLRGKIIPAVSLRLRLNMPEVPYTEETCIIIVKAGNAEAGVIVDRVSDVVTFHDDMTGPVPDMGAGVDASLLSGAGKQGDRVVVLLNMDAVTVLRQTVLKN